MRSHFLLEDALPFRDEDVHDPDEPAVGPPLLVHGVAEQLDLAAVNLDLVQNVRFGALCLLPLLADPLSLVRKPVVYLCAVPEESLDVSKVRIKRYT